jgi:hypothetical protein
MNREARRALARSMRAAHAHQECEFGCAPRRLIAVYDELDCHSCPEPVPLDESPFFSEDPEGLSTHSMTSGTIGDEITVYVSCPRSGDECEVTVRVARLR